MADTFSRLTELTWGSFIIGVSTVVILVVFKSLLSPLIKKHLWPSMPMEIPIDILVVIAGTLLSWAFDFQERSTDEKHRNTASVCKTVQ